MGRAAALLATLLVACTVPAGAEVETCDATWREVEPRVVMPGGESPEPVAIECMRRIGERRVRIGFAMPPGPSCHRLSAVDVVEGADAVSITLVVSRDTGARGEACPEEALPATTEVDLQAPVAERVLLDGSAGR